MNITFNQRFFLKTPVSIDSKLKLPLMLSFAVILSSLSGCGFLHRNTIGLFTDEPQPKPRQSFESPGAVESRSSLGRENTRKIDIEALPTDDEKVALGAVEIIWEIPDSPADAYIIHYGFNRSSLDQKIQIDTEDLERFEDPRHGFVYRHLMNDIPLNKPLFVAMATVRGDQVSERTEIFEVQAMKREAKR